MMLSVVVPAYNEAQRILPSLDQIFDYLERHHPDHEVLVVNDGSTDDTVAVVERRFGQRTSLRILSYGGNRGKGYAVRFGALEARGDVVLFTDADLSTPIAEADKMLPLLAQGYDVVIGSRAHKNAEIREHQPLYRESAGKLFNVLVRLIVGLTFHDTQCGFKLFRRDTTLPVVRQMTIDRFAFDVELLALAQAAGLKVAEVPVVWINSPASNVRLLSGAQAYLDLLPIRRSAHRLKSMRVQATRPNEVQPPPR